MKEIQSLLKFKKKIKATKCEFVKQPKLQPLVKTIENTCQIITKCFKINDNFLIPDWSAGARTYTRRKLNCDRGLFIPKPENNFRVFPLKFLAPRARGCKFQINARLVYGDSRSHNTHISPLLESVNHLLETHVETRLQ